MSKNIWGPEPSPFDLELEEVEERPEPRKLDMKNAKDREEAMRILQVEAIAKNPELVQFKTSTPDRHVSNVMVDDQGHVLPKESIMAGPKANAKDRAEYMKALRAEVYGRNGIKAEDLYKSSRPPKGYKF
ncbi:hypothetical protein [Dyella sedimenti]|uniref:hypothetical protein n=1 Tax=Dyella sedimenti TaxID=2919947 RepID=UPI001FAA2E74|nr:hypothetical protein [Dyella sedimenti]